MRYVVYCCVSYVWNDNRSHRADPCLVLGPGSLIAYDVHSAAGRSYRGPNAALGPTSLAVSGIIQYWHSGALPGLYWGLLEFYWSFTGVYWGLWGFTLPITILSPLIAMLRPQYYIHICMYRFLIQSLAFHSVLRFSPSPSSPSSPGESQRTIYTIFAKPPVPR